MRYRIIKKFIKKNKIDLCISMNSSSMLLASVVTRAYSINSMDYEFQPLNFITFRMASKIIIPSYFDLNTKFTSRVNRSKFVKYSGFKEQIYLNHFLTSNFDRSKFLNKIGLSNTKIIVLIRPSTEGALYHNFNNKMVEVFVEKILRNKECKVILLPRSKSQKKYYKRNFKEITITEEVYSGIDLINASDLVISAGGTMNREAAVLGVPVYSIFQGELGGVDRELIKLKKMIHLKGKKEFAKIKLVKKSRSPEILSNNLLEIFIDEIESSKKYIYR